jgi:hypothetical protein
VWSGRHLICARVARFRVYRSHVIPATNKQSQHARGSKDASIS